MKVLADYSVNNKIPTNSPLDEILGGGVEKGTITQFFGPPGSGKTNIALTLAYNVAKNDKKVMFMDTEGGISLDRIKQISRFDFNKVANNIILFEPMTFFDQGENLKAINLWLNSNKDKVDLLIIDSAVALYRVDDSHSSKLNKELGKQMNVLSNIVRKYNIAVVLTNQIYSSFDDEGNGSIKAVGGTVLQYWSKVIVQLEKGNEVNERIATLIRHRSLAEGISTNFKITSKGIN